jgi:hypothetical protein
MWITVLVACGVLGVCLSTGYALADMVVCLWTAIAESADDGQDLDGQNP